MGHVAAQGYFLRYSEQLQARSGLSAEPGVAEAGPDPDAAESMTYNAVRVGI